MAPAIRIRDSKRAGFWFMACVAFVSLGATVSFPHPWLSPETTVAIAAVSFAAAAVCLARAIWYGVIGVPATQGVSYRQFVQTREKLEKTIAAQVPRALSKAQQIAIERGLSPYRDWQKDHPDIEQLLIAIYPMMTAPDAPQFAQSIGAALRAGGFKVHVAQPSDWNGDPPDITGLMLIADADDPDENVPRLGEWIVAAFASAEIAVVRRPEPGYWQLHLLVGRKPD